MARRGTGRSLIGRRWRMAYNSPSRDGLLIAVNAGLAVTVAPISTIAGNLEVLTPRPDLPELPLMGLSLHQSKRPLAKPTKLLATAIRETLSEAGGSAS